MEKMKKIILIVTVFSFCLQAMSQKLVADKFYNNYAYSKAADLYKLVVKKGKEDVEILTKLGDCYYNVSDSKNAIYWYDLALKKGEVTDEYKFKYAQSLKSLGKYKEAEKILKHIRKKKSNKELVAYYEELQNKHQDSIKVFNLDLNTKHSDFGTYVHKNQLFFSSTKNEVGKKYSWNNEPYLDIYQALIEKKDDKTIVKSVGTIPSNKINTSFHEANIAITKDGNTIYFTRNNLNRRNKLDYDKEGTSHLKIFKATKSNNGLFDNIVELPFNDDVFSTGHPALSSDEKTLYFTSNRPGGYGQTDIYKVAIVNKGESYGKPINLGAKINTKDKEMFPFVAEDNTFYFSSDGYETLGYLDIFKSDFLKNADAKVINMGAPFNSGFDDFSVYVSKDKRSGYFSSNRKGGKGQDDIYMFESYKCEQTIQGNVYDKKTNELLPNSLVELIDAKGKVIETLVTNEKAEYLFNVECDKEYKIRASKKDYQDDLAIVKTSKINGFDNKQDLYLVPLVIKKEIVVNPIFFDFDKWDIRPDAAFELEGIVDVLRNNPKMIIKIESHTDARGKDEYNLILSDRRAKSTRDYIISRNIDSKRIISAIGYGESQLINKCKNGVKCSDEEHEENRRSKFIIVKQ